MATKEIAMSINMKPEFKKECPVCRTMQTYTSKYTLKSSIAKNTLCNKCRQSEKKIELPVNGWCKPCPTCGSLQVYSCKSSLTAAIKNCVVCESCHTNKLRTRLPSDKWRRICPTCQCELVYKSYKGYLISKIHNTKCRKCSTPDRVENTDNIIYRTSEYRAKMSTSIKKVRNSDRYGESFKQKCRENKLKQIREQGTKYTYNPIACKFMDFLNYKFGWNLQHAMNGGEVCVIGYSLDGYDKIKKIIFEYDEPKHRISSTKERDKIRQERIVNAIRPVEFWRYDEKDKKLVEIISNKEVICQPQ